MITCKALVGKMKMKNVKWQCGLTVSLVGVRANKALPTREAERRHVTW